MAGPSHDLAHEGFSPPETRRSCSIESRCFLFWGGFFSFGTFSSYFNPQILLRNGKKLRDGSLEDRVSVFRFCFLIFEALSADNSKDASLLFCLLAILSRRNVHKSLLFKLISYNFWLFIIKTRPCNLFSLIQSHTLRFGKILIEIYWAPFKLQPNYFGRYTCAFIKHIFDFQIL